MHNSYPTLPLYKVIGSPDGCTEMRIIDGADRYLRPRLDAENKLVYDVYTIDHVDKIVRYSGIQESK